MTTFKNGKPILPGTQLTIQQLRALDSLTAGTTIKQAATNAKTSVITVRKWLEDDDEFRKAFKTAGQTARQQLVNQLVELGSSSVVELQKALQSKDKMRRLIAAKAGLTAVGPIAKATVDAVEGNGAGPLFQLPAGAEVSLNIDIPAMPDTKPSIVTTEVTEAIEAHLLTE